MTAREIAVTLYLALGILKQNKQLNNKKLWQS